MKEYLLENYIKEGENIAVQSNLTEEKELPHTHRFIEMIYVKGGTGRHCIDGESYKVKKGNLLFVKLKETHSFEPEPKLDYINILIKPDFFDNGFFHSCDIYRLFSLFLYSDRNGIEKSNPLVEFGGVEMLEIENLIDSMLNEFNGKRNEYESIICFYLQILIAKTIRRIKESEDKSSLSYIDSVMDGIMLYIEKNFSEKLKLSEIAKNFFYNPSYISRAFKSYYGKNFKDLVQDKRLGKAAELLTGTNLTIDKVAENTGYTDKKQFYRFFKQAFNCTPKEFREKSNRDKK